MKIKIITVGRVKGPHEIIVKDYLARLTHYVAVEHVVVKSDEEIARRLSAGDFLIVLDEGGRPFKSVEFSKYLEDKQNRSTRGVVFIIGGAPGLSEAIKTKANIKMSLSSMTLQHDLALIVLLEQIYRAYSIIKGEPYHK